MKEENFSGSKPNIICGPKNVKFSRDVKEDGWTRGATVKQLLYIGRTCAEDPWGGRDGRLPGIGNGHFGCHITVT